MTTDISRLEVLVRDYAAQKAADAAKAFVELAQSLVPRRTWDLHDSIQVDRLVETPDGVTAYITVGAPYASFVNYGTGIYGPEGVPITPKNGPFLYFDSMIFGHVIRKREVRGSEPTHFWERTIERWPEILAGLS